MNILKLLLTCSPLTTRVGAWYGDGNQGKSRHALSRFLKMEHNAAYYFVEAEKHLRAAFEREE